MPILEWLNKGEATKVTKKLPYRMLKANAELSYGEQSENMIIKGDNLEALQALIPYYKGQIKCIYIDPPYNTGSAFEHYDDNLEHSTWLSLLYPRLELLRELLTEDGSIWISIDSKEVAYLQIVMDEIFGRTNRLSSITVKVKDPAGVGQQSVIFDVAEYMLAYAKDLIKYRENSKDLYDFTEITEPINGYNNYIKNYGTPELVKTINRAGVGDINIYTCKNAVVERINSNLPFQDYLKLINNIAADYNPNGGMIVAIKDEIPAEGLSYIEYVPIRGKNQGKLSKIYFKNKRILSFAKDITIQNKGKIYKRSKMTNLWTMINSSLHLEGGVDFPNGKKSEALISKVISCATNEGDLVLDSFLGSGTTCAVAQKMGRRYIGIEMGEHAITHCVPRMKAVIDGEQGGISKAVNWNGGGGYTFYDLGETIFDENGNINKQVDFKTLASHVWFTETKTPYTNNEKSPLLGTHNGVAYYLLFNGILGDKKPDGGNVLTQKVLDSLPVYEGKKVIYGEATRMNAEKLKANNIVFKQTPYDVKAR